MLQINLIKKLAFKLVDFKVYIKITYLSFLFMKIFIINFKYEDKPTF